jgi:hypothetical protein
MNDGKFLIQDFSSDLKYSLGIVNDEGIFWSKYDLNIQPDENSGFGIININGSIDFNNENNSIKYKTYDILNFYDSVYGDEIS